MKTMRAIAILLLLAPLSACSTGPGVEPGGPGLFLVYAIGGIGAKRPNALNVSAQNGTLAQVKIMVVAQPWRVNQYDDYDGRMPIHAAAHGGQVAVIEYLISQGASINAETKDGKTAFQEAVLVNQLGAMRALLEHGADPKLTINGSPLLAVVTKSQTFGCKTKTEVSRLLIEVGANVNSVVSSSPIRTVLTEAIQGRCRDTVALLLMHGADPNLGSSLQWIREQRPDPRLAEIEEVLLSYGAKE